MNYRKRLEERFSKYQAILGDRLIEQGEDRIDLDNIVNDFCCMDEEGRVVLKYIPIKGNDVYYTIYSKEMDEDSAENFIIPLAHVGESQLSYLVELMRKAMIIEELRNTLCYERLDH